MVCIWIKLNISIEKQGFLLICGLYIYNIFDVVIKTLKLCLSYICNINDKNFFVILHIKKVMWTKPDAWPIIIM